MGAIDVQRGTVNEHLRFVAKSRTMLFMRSEPYEMLRILIAATTRCNKEKISSILTSAVRKQHRWIALDLAF